jgi:hypothetical protein
MRQSVLAIESVPVLVLLTAAVHHSPLNRRQMRQTADFLQVDQDCRAEEGGEDV